MARKLSKESNVTQEYLKALFRYDEATGNFIRIRETLNSSPIGSMVGTLNKSLGYIVISINSEVHYAHRLVWLYVHGNFPTELIDHINGDRCDNRLCNLRLATGSNNQCNRLMSKRNKSGYKGVSWSNTRNKWVAQCMVDGKYKFLGYFDTAQEASSVYQNYTKVQHGEFYKKI